MPLRDHFHAPYNARAHWDAIHGQWPAMIVLDLQKKLPPNFVANPFVHLGSSVEVDVGTFGDESIESDWEPPRDSGSLMTAVWAPPAASSVSRVNLDAADTYEVRVYDFESDRRLVAAIEIVSPSNKRSPKTQNEFISKCESLLRLDVNVVIVDVVTNYRVNLFRRMMESLQASPAAIESAAGDLYAVSCRMRHPEKDPDVEAWIEELQIGEGLPTLPLWLTTELAVPLDLDATYAATCGAFGLK